MQFVDASLDSCPNLTLSPAVVRNAYETPTALEAKSAETNAASRNPILAFQAPVVQVPSAW